MTTDTPARQPQYKEHKVPLREHCKRESRCYYKPNKPCRVMHCEYDTRATHTSPLAPEQCPHWKDANNLKSDFRDQIKGDHYCDLPSPDQAAKAAREQREKELWEWCLINGAEQHGDIIGLPKDPFFPLKLIKKIAEMHYESLRAQQQAGERDE